ncbi:hypothetical protein HMPREF1544_07967 [Mucor circinelloides 1006PhL]|uniref:Uncharacterized protein n=1 Tax=Mucor circinelloides f. circinelloides (strain 1006PhL) TaxID=1220926 RepID=S2J576_MUCC1|nr:hypothetical protein HMPREF1544_07967 [Mucor circinelloides 1006PhL]
MKPRMRVQTSMTTSNRASRRFSTTQQKKSPDVSTQQLHHHQQSTESACKSGYSNHTISPFTPPPSPSPKNKLRYSQRNYTENRSTINILADELIDMFEQAVQQCTAAENRYKRLDLTIKSTLKLQTKTYEHCIKELNERIETLQSHSPQHLSTNSDFLSKFIDGYAEDDTLELDRDNQIEALKQQILLNEQSAQQMIAHYLGELERERLKIKHKDSIIAKQDALISTLETKMQNILNQQNTADNSLQTSVLSKNEKLLEAQIELQAIELEDKKKLLAMLLHERDELSIKASRPKSKNTKKHSSIDLLAKIVQTDIPSCAPALDVLQLSDLVDRKKTPSPLAFKKSHVFNDHSPPPPSPPPKSPLPPTPRRLVKPPPRSVSTRKSKPRRLTADQYQSGVKSWSCLDFEKAANETTTSRCYYMPPSLNAERPIYQPSQESREWRKHLVQELVCKPYENMAEQPPIEDNHGFSSLVRHWKRHVI